MLRPIVWVLQGSASLLLRPFGVREVIAGESIRTAAELRALVDEAEESGVIPRAQEELLHNVFDFPDREARDIMVPALDVALARRRAVADRGARPASSRFRTPAIRSGAAASTALAGVLHMRDLVARRARG